MADIDQYAPGTPSWVDVSSPDLDASAAFYGGLFGWTSWEAEPAEEAGGYRMFTMRDRSVAGLGPTREGGPPPMWTTYVTVADADETAGKAKAAGGTVFMEPFDVLDVGRMAVMGDAQGAMFAIWQPRKHIGAGIVNEPGSLVWNELATTDPDAAKAFYAAVFGWAAETQQAPGGDYTTFKLGDGPVAGMMAMGENYPPGVPPNWLTYFAVADCDAAVGKAQELGARLNMPPMTVPVGTFAVLGDPQGAVFGVIAMTSEV